MTDDTILLDIRGQICPSALLLALRELNRLQATLVESGCVLEIHTDHRDATGTIPVAARNMGFESELEKLDGCYRVRIWHDRKRGDSE